MNKKVLFGFAVSTMTLGVVAAAIVNQHPVEADAAVNTNYSSIFLAGTMNNWLGDHGLKALSSYGRTYGFTYDHESNGSHFYTLTASFEKDQTFKIYDHEHDVWNNYWDSTSISSELLGGGNNEQGDNITCRKTGVYLITYRYTSGTDKQITGFVEADVTAATQINSWAQDFLSDTATICSTNGEDANHFDALNNIWADEASDGATNYSVAGNFTDWETNPINMKRVGESSVYRLSDIYLAKWSQFKILVNGSEWHPDNNIEIQSAGYYRIEIDVANNNYVSHTRMRYIKAGYTDLPAAAKELFVANSSNPNVAEAYARYVHIVTRYELDNFAGATLNPGAASQAEFKENNAVSAPIVVSIVGAAIVGVGAFFFLYKRKEQ